MEATHCLRLPQAAAEKLHRVRTLGRRTPALIPSRRHLVLHRAGPAASSFSGIALGATPDRGCRPVVRARAPSHREDAGDGKASGRNRQAAARVAAAVALLCFLGVVRLNLKRWGFAHAIGRPLGRPPSSSSFPFPMQERSPVQKSLDVLHEIFQRKAEDDAQKLTTLTELLCEKLKLGEDKLNKKYPSLLEISDKGREAANSLYTEWEKKDGVDKYDIGMLLIDVLINQGEYKEADHVCTALKEFAPSDDVSYPLHKAIINMMLAVDCMLLTYSIGQDCIEETEKTKDLKKMIDGAVLKLIEYRKETDGKPPPITQDGVSL